MSLAGVIDRQFTGISGGGTENADENALYFSSTGKGKYFIANRQPYGGIFGQHDTANLVVVGSNEPGQNIWWKTLTVAETYGIDLKLDDGIADKGKVFGATGYGTASTNCSEIFTHPSGASYNLANLSDDANHCVLLFHFLN